MAGAPGFEPGNAGTKNRCLTAWLRPNKSDQRDRLRGAYSRSPRQVQSSIDGFCQALQHAAYGLGINAGASAQFGHRRDLRKP